MPLATTHLAHAVSWIHKSSRAWPKTLERRHLARAHRACLCHQALSCRCGHIFIACARWHAFYCIKPFVHAESVLHIANICMLDLQIAISDREQEIMGAAGLLTIGGGAGVGRGTLEQVLRVLPGEITPTS